MDKSKKRKRQPKKNCCPPPILNRWEWEMLQQHRERVKNAEPRVDDKPSVLNRYMYYRPKVLLDRERNLQVIMAENKELLKRINIINRTTGRIDTHLRIKMKPISKEEERIAEMRRITLENRKILERILTQGPKVATQAELNKEWKRKLEIISTIGKYPYGCYNKEEPYPWGDGVHWAPSPSMLTIRVKKNRPRCFFDVGIENDRHLGRFIIELYEEFVPLTTANFLALCQGTEDGLTYKNCPFHRIIPGIMCQGGDITKFTGNGGVSIYGETFADENFYLKHNEPGVLSMSNTGPDSNNSQFNISFKRLLCLNGKNVVFGKIVRGINTLYSIEGLGARSGKPLARVIITNCGQYFPSP